MIDPTKPKGQASATPAPQAPLPSTHEWRDGFYSSSSDGDGEVADSSEASTPRPTSEPVKHWYTGLVDHLRDNAVPRLQEMARVTPRALAQAGNSITKFAGMAAHAYTRPTILEALDPNVKAAGDAEAKRLQNANVVSQDEITLAYGPQSDDTVANVYESVIQGGAAILATSPLLGSGFMAGVAGGVAGFDMYDHQLAEVAATYGNKIPGIGGAVAEMGKLASVDEQDSFLTAFLKRSAADGLVGLAFEGAFWTVKALAATKVGDAAAEAAARTKLTDIVDGNHTPEGAQVVVRPNENGNGTWKILDNPADGPQFVGEQKGGLAINGKGAFDEPPAGTPFDPDTFVPVDNFSETSTKATYLLPNGDEAYVSYHLSADGELRIGFIGANGGENSLGPRMTRQIGRDLVQRTGAKKITGYRMSGAGAGREVSIDLTNGPAFTSRAEAEVQAHTINQSLNGRIKAQEPILFSKEDVAAHVQLGEKIAAAKTPEDAARLIDNAHFNFNWFGGTERVKAQIAALSERIGKEIDGAQAGKGATSHKAVAKTAAEVARTLGIRDWAERVAGMAAERSQGHVELLMANAAVRQLGGDLANLSGKIRLRPHDPALLADAKDLLELWAPLTRDVAGLNSQAGRDLNIMQARNIPEAANIKFPKETPQPKVADSPAAGTNGKPVADPKSAPQYDHLSEEEIKAALRMFELSGGRVRNAQAIIEGMKVLKKSDGPVGKVIDFATNAFVNFLISGPKTMLTIFSSGQALLHFEHAVRTLAGVASFNPKLAREGADMLYAHYMYAWDNVKAAGAALRENRSVLDPSPALYQQGGIIPTVIQTPGRVAGTLDEFTRVTGYRSYVRAKSLRMAREEGLSGAALVNRVEDDVRASIDAKTGVGINEEAIDFAGIPTLSNHPGTGTFSGDLANFLAKYPLTKFIAPFIRPGVNTFRYVGKATPGLNILYKDMRAKLLGSEGSEEAAIAWTRSAMAGAAYSYAWFKCLDGTITGRGPSDPVLRAEWLADHKPYSVRLTGEDGKPYYKSYRRMDPFASFLGLAADAHVVALEMADKEGTDAEDIGKAVFGSLLNNYVNKSYNQGLADFFGAVDDNDGSSLDKWSGGIVGGFQPQLVQSFNTDPYYREARGLVDEYWKRTPGLSDKLPPKYNFLGEPIMKQGSVFNRNVSIAPTLDASPKVVEDALLQDHIKFSPPPDKELNTQIDFKDPRWKKSDGDKLPYVRWMELVANGFDGEPGIRKQMEALIQSDEWRDATSGASSFPGGERGLMAAKLLTGVQNAAKQKMLDEYPVLRDAWEGAKGMMGTARGEGQAGVNARRAEFGTPVPHK